MQSCINGRLNGHGLVIIFEVKIVFTYQYKKFQFLAFKIYSKKRYRNIE